MIFVIVLFFSFFSFFCLRGFYIFIKERKKKTTNPVLPDGSIKKGRPRKSTQPVDGDGGSASTPAKARKRKREETEAGDGAAAAAST